MDNPGRERPVSAVISDKGKSGPEALRVPSPPLSPLSCDVALRRTDKRLSYGSSKATANRKSVAGGPDFPRRSPGAAGRVGRRGDLLVESFGFCGTAKLPTRKPSLGSWESVERQSLGVVGIR